MRSPHCCSRRRRTAGNRVASEVEEERNEVEERRELLAGRLVPTSWLIQIIKLLILMQGISDRCLATAITGLAA